jgi:hypothetical protein
VTTPRGPQHASGSSAAGGSSLDDPSAIADGRAANTVDLDDRVRDDDAVTRPGNGSGRAAEGGADGEGDGADRVVVLDNASDVEVPAERAKRHRRFNPWTRYRAGMDRHPARTWILTGVVAVLLLAMLTAADVAYQSLRIYHDIKASIGVLQEAKAGVHEGQLPTAGQFYDAAAKARDARSRVQHADPLFRLSWSIPGLRQPMRALRAASVAAGAEARVATDLGNLSAQLIGPGGGAKSGSFAVYKDGAVDVAVLKRLPDELERLTGDLRETQSAIRQIPNVPMFHRIEKLKTKALKDSTAAITLLHTAIQGSKLLPEFLGADGPRTYFIAIQNNADQRGTGGAVLGYALVRFNQGKFDILRGGGIKNIDNKRFGFHVGYPAGIQWYLDQSHNAARINNGANYTADFPLVGRSWTKMAQVATGDHIDGVIAIDPFAIADALKGQGPLDVPAYPKPIDSTNLVQVTEHNQYLLSKKQQIDLPHELIKSAFKDLEHPKNFVHMANGLAGAVAARHVQVWLADPQLQSLVKSLGWDGSIDPGTGDAVAVVYDKRIRGKQDFWTQESIDYHVALSASGDATSDVKVTMSDEIPKGQPPRIVSHVRPYGLNAAMLNLYVPERAVLQSVTPSGALDESFVSPPLFFNYLHPTEPQEHVERTFRVFTQTVTPWPGHPKTVEWKYTVPKVVHTTSAGRVYRLVIPHQPLYRDPVVDLTIQLPSGAHVISATKGMTVSGSTVTLHTNLAKDLAIQIVF